MDPDPEDDYSLTSDDGTGPAGAEVDRLTVKYADIIELLA